MASSVYSEVTSVSTYGYERDRVLDKLQIASEDLPYNISDITISHNDFAVADVYNDSIRKLYSNYLFLIANAEVFTNNTPVSAPNNYIAIQTDGTAKLSATNVIPNTATHTASLSTLQETFIVSQTDNNGKILFLNYAKDDSSIYETDTDITTVTALLSGNEVEFNKTFKFKNVVSVDTSGNILFVLDKGANTVFKFDVTGLITNDKSLKRTSINDSKRPGRYLLKTIGGEGTGQTKNKLLRPNGLSVYKNRVYILDNGHNSVKVFDLDFNFIHEISSPNLFNNPNYGDLVSIVVDQYSDTVDFAQGYILSNKGKVITYDIVNNRLKPPTSLYDYYDTRINVLSGIKLNNSFKKIVNSKVKKNILYICNDGRIYKYYKTNFKNYISEIDLDTSTFTSQTNLSAVGNNTNEYQILSFDTTLHNNKEYIAVTTKNNPHNQVSTNIFIDEHVTTKLYNENFYTNYFTLSNILVLPQEIVNNITFNKTTKKLIYNHYSLFENLNKKIYSYYKTSSELNVNEFAPYPVLSAIVPHQFERPTELQENHNLFIGVNEPLLTDVINRPLKLLFNQQSALFDLIKEESLNTNPPSNRPTYLPGTQTTFPNFISFASTTSEVNAGEDVEVIVTRVNVLTGAPACSFKYYTLSGDENGLNPASTDTFENVVVGNPSIETFQKDENTFTIKLATAQFFGNDRKIFRIVIEENTNCVIDPTANTHQVTIKPIGKQFTVTLDSSTGTLEEGSTSQVKINRIPNSGTAANKADTSVNIRIVPTGIADTQYTPVIPASNEYSYITNKGTDFPLSGGSTAIAQEVKNTSTITFNESITSVVFDLSAVNNKTSDFDGRMLSVLISNPSDNADLGNITQQDFLVNDKFETISLHLSSISATYRADGTSNTLLSCVNIWEALSASTEDNNGNAYSAISSDNPVLVNFTVNSPLSVFSVSTISGALQFEPDHDLNFSNNKFNFIVDDGAAIVGMGGRGGHGAQWSSGSDFSQDGTGGDDLSAFYHEGLDGGFAIGSINMTSYFNVITITNSGKVFGGAGGGGGGVLGVSAESMPDAQYLSAGCGGGGGAGIHAANTGGAGLASVSAVEDDSTGIITETQNGDFADIFLANGNAGLGNAVGGDGGAFTNVGGVVTLGTGSVIISSFPAMSGLDGGQLGEPGGTDGNIPVLPDPYHPNTNTFGGTGNTGTGFSSISSDFAVRAGGEAGYIVEGTFTTVTSAGTGVTKGRGMVGINLITE